MAEGVDEGNIAPVAAAPSTEVIKNLASVLKRPDFVGRSLALVVTHPEFIARSIAMAVGNPGFAMVLREIETRSVAAIPGLLPGLPPLPPMDVLRMGGEVAASAAACHVGTVIYDRLLRRHPEVDLNDGSALKFKKDAIAKSFLDEIAIMEQEAAGGLRL
jgi:hypothetical protein